MFALLVDASASPDSVIVDDVPESAPGRVFVLDEREATLVPRLEAFGFASAT